MSRRGRAWVLAALVLGAALVAMAAFVPVPYVVRSPGPVFDILGQYEGKPVLEITGARTHDTTGQLDMTTVAETGGGSSSTYVVSGIAGLLQSAASVLPQPPDAEGEEQVQLAVFDASKSDALGAAARYLDRPVSSEPVVIGVTPGSNAEGQLQAGDVLETVNGKPIRRAEQVGEIISPEPVGTRFVFEVQRSGEPVRVVVRSGKDPEDPERAVVGILVADRYSSDFEVTVNLAQIGGPSAGLMLALGIVDRLSPGDLLAGRHVAGTGSIGADGTVGTIGGIDKKMIAARQAGAELFLTPEGNCEDTVGVTPEGLTVAPVGSLADAVAVLEDWRSGKALPTCAGEVGP